MEERFDFKALIDRMVGLTRAEMIQEAESDFADITGLIAPGARGASEARAAGGTAYRARMIRLLYWLRYGKHPDGRDEADRVAYRRLAEDMIGRGMMKPGMLEKL